MSAVIPASYVEWRHCIEVDCGIALAPAFIEQRLRALRDPGSQEMLRFARLYGNDHLQRVTAWFERARRELPAPP
jgi:hypothetical protein